jgi:hypothetical protein
MRRPRKAQIAAFAATNVANELELPYNSGTAGVINKRLQAVPGFLQAQQSTELRLQRQEARRRWADELTF